MHYFGVPNLCNKLCHERIQSNLLDPKWCLWVFRSISQRFDTKIHTKVVFRGWKHYFGVPNFRKMFCHEHIQYNLLDQKWCLRVFRSISQTFDTKIHAKLVFQGWRYYFGVPSFQKKFCHECIQSNPIDPKWFGSVSEHFANLRHEKSCKTCISSPKGLFQRTELSEKVLPRTHPI